MTHKSRTSAKNNIRNEFFFNKTPADALVAFMAEQGKARYGVSELYRGHRLTEGYGALGSSDLECLNKATRATWIAIKDASKKELIEKPDRWWQLTDKGRKLWEETLKPELAQHLQNYTPGQEPPFIITNAAAQELVRLVVSRMSTDPKIQALMREAGIRQNPEHKK